MSSPVLEAFELLQQHVPISFVLDFLSPQRLSEHAVHLTSAPNLVFHGLRPPRN